jgi:hypothetical protein
LFDFATELEKQAVDNLNKSVDRYGDAGELHYPRIDFYENGEIYVDGIDADFITIMASIRV